MPFRNSKCSSNILEILVQLGEQYCKEKPFNMIVYFPKQNIQVHGCEVACKGFNLLQFSPTERSKGCIHKGMLMMILYKIKDNKTCESSRGVRDIKASSFWNKSVRRIELSWGL